MSIKEYIDVAISCFIDYMRKLIVMQCEEIICRIKEYPINKLIFWLGAGIDRDSPTELPLGYELTDDILERTCGKELSRKILQEWKNTACRINEISKEVIHVDEYPRLETILEAVRIFEDNLFGNSSVINGLKSFADAPPNDNHYILAEMLHQGANIVTTNYDCCIPIAYNKLFQQGDDKMLLCNDDNLWIYKSEVKNVGAIYHLHGIAQCIKNIGATLSVIKNPIARKFDQRMNEWLKGGYCFVFLGYGGVDTLDITPYLRNKRESVNSLGIYVRHSSESYKNIVKCANVRERDLLHCFTNQYILSYNTKDFLREYSGKRFELAESVVNNWKEKFSASSIAYTSELQRICALGIIHSLDLDPCKILGEQWTDEYSGISNSCVDNWYIGNYGFRNALRCGKVKEIYHFTKLMKESELLLSDIHRAKNYFMSYILDRKYRKKVKLNIYDVLRDKEVIDWNISTPINREVQFILFVFLRSPLNINYLTKLLKRRGLELIKIIENLIDAGPIYLLEINQLNVAYIDLAILEMVCTQNYVKAWENISKARYNYAEISSISGVINTFFYEIIYFEIKYWRYRNKEYKERVKILYKKTITILSNERYCSSYKEMLNLVENFGKKADIRLHI